MKYSPRPGNRTVLIVDDEVEMLDLLHNILADQENFTVVVARSGNTAIKILADITVDCVLTDLYMDDGDGIKVVDYCRANNISVVVQTAHDPGNLEMDTTVISKLDFSKAAELLHFECQKKAA